MLIVNFITYLRPIPLKPINKFSILFMMCRLSPIILTQLHKQEAEIYDLSYKLPGSPEPISWHIQKQSNKNWR
jgi:hypothetical protein